MPRQRDKKRLPIEVVIVQLCRDASLSKEGLCDRAEFSMSTYFRALRGEAGPEAYFSIGRVFKLPDDFLWDVVMGDLAAVREADGVPESTTKVAIRALSRAS